MPFLNKRRRYSRPNKGRKPRVTKRGVRKAINQYKSKVFAAAVKQVLKRHIEDKHVMEQASLMLRTNSPVDPSYNPINVDNANIIRIDQDVALGTNVSSRIGNKINVTKVLFKYGLIINSLAAGGVTNPTNVRMVFFYDREYPTEMPTPTFNGNFFDNNGGSQAFSGDYTDMIKGFNTDRYRILKVKTFKLGNSYSTGTTGNNLFWSNNDYKMNYRGTLDLTKHVIKRQKFNDNLSISQNRKLYMLAYLTTPNISVMTAASTPVVLTYQTEMFYEDA